jgi:hypothetical protein
MNDIERVVLFFTENTLLVKPPTEERYSKVDPC